MQAARRHGPNSDTRQCEIMGRQRTSPLLVLWPADRWHLNTAVNTTQQVHTIHSALLLLPCHSCSLCSLVAAGVLMLAATPLLPICCC